MSKGFYFTSESVSCGHPDKMCDTIVDYIKDYILQHDDKARIALEAFVTTDFIVIGGEVTTSIKVPYEYLVREAIRQIGYVYPEDHFSYDSVQILNRVHSQSPDIAMGTNDDISGAGDQGIIFGYANNETEQCYPLAGIISRELTTKAHENSLKDDTLRPDIKSQVTVYYDENNKISVDTIVMAVSHSEALTRDEVQKKTINEVIKPVLAEHNIFVNDVRRIIVNGTGKFVIYGPNSDTGLTGRKLALDQYQGYSHIGGGTMQGKDPTKVDNSAALMARYIAKTLVKSKICGEAQVQLSYCIGVSEPISIDIDTKNTLHKYTSSIIEQAVRKVFDCTPKGMINTFKLRHPDGWTYRECSSNGWFGNNRQQVPWESDDKVQELLQTCENLIHVK